MDMRRLTAFDNVSLDGYFVDAHGDMSWAHSDDPEWNEFVAGNARGGGVLVFGRVTYDMMASYWPTAMAMEQNPAVAAEMNSMPKVVFSRTMERAEWSGTTVMKGDIVEEMRRMKGESGPDMAILGSGTIVAQFAQAGLIDELQIVVHPVVLGGGRTLFEGVTGPVRLTLVGTRAFENGNVLLRYAPAS
jgi:dihydrofolate reductase